MINTILTIIGIICVFAIILALPVMLLWNWLMPLIFGITKITFFQALGINLLCGILFKSNKS